jgi:hypothetical protein
MHRPSCKGKLAGIFQSKQLKIIIHRAPVELCQHLKAAIVAGRSTRRTASVNIACLRASFVVALCSHAGKQQLTYGQHSCFDGRGTYEGTGQACRPVGRVRAPNPPRLHTGLE